MSLRVATQPVDFRFAACSNAPRIAPKLALVNGFIKRESVLSSWPPFHQQATEQMVQTTANRGKARMPVAVPFTTILARRF